MNIIFFDTRYQMTTLGLLHVATYLEKSGYPSKYVFLSRQEGKGIRQVFKQKPDIRQELDSILDFIEQEKPDLIGMTLMMINFYRARDLTEEIKKKFPEIPVLWGGIHPTFDPDECIKYADYVCVGEGEDATLELVRKLENVQDTTGIPNIWTKSNDRVIKNEVRPLIQNLDDYPFPKINFSSTYCLDHGKVKPLTIELLRKYARYSGTMYDVIISRGCPHACSYCCNSLFRSLYKGKGKYVRYRSVDKAIEELRYVKETFDFVRILNIQDDSFAASSEEYLADFAEKYSSQIGFPVRMRAIASLLNETRVKHLVKTNVLSVIIGVQSNDRINKTVFNRHIPSESVLRAAKLLKSYNIVGEYQFISSNPYSNEQDMVEICEILADIPRPYRLQMLDLGIFPHTGLWEKAKQDGLEVNKSDGYDYNYGAYPEKFPILRAIQEVAPHTPRSLILFFVKHRHSKGSRWFLRTYKFLYVDSIAFLRDIALSSSFLVLLAQKILLLKASFSRRKQLRTACL